MRLVNELDSLLMNDLSEKFRKSRIAIGKSVSDIANEFGLSINEIAEFEAGQKKPPVKFVNILDGYLAAGKKEPLSKSRKSTFTFVDLFAGIGGFHQALKELNGQCVAACENNDLARKTYLENHDVPSEYFFEDINFLNPSQIPSHDVLCAGFPCQPFSISGKQKALKDSRSDVIESLFGIIEYCMPKIVILENVKHIKHVDGGRAFLLVTKTLEELGYDVSYELLNAKDFGVPQNRERWLFVGTLKNKYKFKQPKTKTKPLRYFLDDKEDDYFSYLQESFTLIKEPKVQKSGLIFMGYRNKGIRKKGVRVGTEHLSRVHKQPNRIYSIDGIHPTLPSQESSGRFWILLDDGRVRKLTIDECFRIMGFPENFIKPVSLGNLYKQIGNSVCVPMVRDVMKNILENQLIQIED